MNSIILSCPVLISLKLYPKLEIFEVLLMKAQWVQNNILNYFWTMSNFHSMYTIRIAIDIN
jgi:hypothetical protein